VRHVAEVAHAVPGRVRLRIASARGKPELLNAIKTDFATMPGVDSIDAKLDSGSLVIYYDAEHHPEMASLFRAMSQVEALPLVIPPSSPTEQRPHRPVATKVDEMADAIEGEAEFLADHSTIARQVVEAMRGLDRSIKQSTNNNVDLKIMVPLGLAAVTFLEIGAAAATPMWVTLAIFSMNHFIELHAHDADKD
jgi:nitrate reductase NapAB chaperone NapD